MEFNNNSLDHLVERFWSGEASLEEEQQLREMFKYGHVPEGMEDLATYFEAIDEEQVGLSLDASFDDKIIKKIEASSGKKVISIRKWFIPIAAALIAAAVFIGVQTDEPSGLAEEPSKEEVKEAYKQTEQALFLISSKMKKGNQHMLSLNKFNKAQTRIKNIEE